MASWDHQEFCMHRLCPFSNLALQSWKLKPWFSRTNLNSFTPFLFQNLECPELCSVAGLHVCEPHQTTEMLFYFVFHSCCSMNHLLDESFTFEPLFFLWPMRILAYSCLKGEFWRPRNGATFPDLLGCDLNVKNQPANVTPMASGSIWIQPVNPPNKHWLSYSEVELLSLWKCAIENAILHTFFMNLQSPVHSDTLQWNKR